MLEIADFIVRPSSPVVDLHARPSRTRKLASCLARAGRAVAAWIDGRAEATASALLRCHVRQALHRLDDRMLTDIGIARADIDSIARGELPPRVSRDLASSDCGWRQAA